MANYEKYLDESKYPREVVALAKEIHQLRQMLWLGHGHRGMYGDDGEMQCSECIPKYGFWDWKRTEIDEIVKKIWDAQVKEAQNLAAEPQQVPKKVDDPL